MDTVSMPYDYSHYMGPTLGPRQLAHPQYDHGPNMSVYNTSGLPYSPQFVSPSCMYNQPPPAPSSQNCYSPNFALPTRTAPRGQNIPPIQKIPHFQDLTRREYRRMSTTPLFKCEGSDSSCSSTASPSDTTHCHGESSRFESSRSDGNDVNEDSGTEVDRLMKTIQSRSEPSHMMPAPQPLSLLSRYPPHLSYHHCEVELQPRIGIPLSHQPVYGRQHHPYETGEQRAGYTNRRKQKKHCCDHPGCDKAFTQRTHLEIHKRKHSGERPFKCSFSQCTATFSQMGNLRTHERRHLDQRPFVCAKCDKAFSQRGNLRAHASVHSSEPKPYSCRLEGCSKMFSQLGNLKSHMNRFHEVELKRLAVKFAGVGEGGRWRDDRQGGGGWLRGEELELWEWFEKVFRHCNRGIKGRGKDRRVLRLNKGSDNTGVSSGDVVENLEDCDGEDEYFGLELPPLRNVNIHEPELKQKVVESGGTREVL